MISKTSKPLGELIEELKKLPGIGPKSAQRLAFYILSLPEEEINCLAKAIVNVKKQVKQCSRCFNISLDDLCDICSDKGRDETTICVVSEPKDLLAIERSGVYKGLYHVLGGVISPLDGFNPDGLKIKELMKRLKSNNIKEIILAINPSTEGEATVLYLTNLIKPLNLKLTKIAYGLPMGSDMDYADEVTIIKSLEGRKEV